MKRIHAEDAKPTTQINFLPVIGDPNAHMTIFTTLKECLRLSNEEVAVVIFDLPIWLKAPTIQDMVGSCTSWVDELNQF